MIYLIDMATPDISSTDIRRRIASGLPITGLVPGPVAVYIQTHKLYQGKVMTEEKHASISLDTLPQEIRDAVSASQDKKAEGIVILALAAITSFTDYFIVMHGRSGKQLNALSDGIERALRSRGRRPLSIEGKKNAEWILMDYGSFIIHIFTKEKRDYYTLERLWADVPRVEVPDPEGP